MFIEPISGWTIDIVFFAYVLNVKMLEFETRIVYDAVAEFARPNA